MLQSQVSQAARLQLTDIIIDAKLRKALAESMSKEQAQAFWQETGGERGHWDGNEWVSL